MARWMKPLQAFTGLFRKDENQEAGCFLGLLLCGCTSGCFREQIEGTNRPAEIVSEKSRQKFQGCRQDVDAQQLLGHDYVIM